MKVEATLSDEDWRLIILAVDTSDNDPANEKLEQDLYDALEHKLCLMFPEIVKRLQKETGMIAKFEDEFH